MSDNATLLAQIIDQATSAAGEAIQSSANPLGQAKSAPTEAKPQGSADPLVRLESKLDDIRDGVEAIVKGGSFGFYLWGNGGTSKSYTVLEELRRLEANVQYYNSRLTALRLAQLLDAHKSAIFLLEDMERITADKDAQGVLRSALWGQKDGKYIVRRVQWQSAAYDYDFEFKGGIIMISNRPLGNLPELDALKTRIKVNRFEADRDELIALMRSVAVKGYQHADERFYEWMERDENDSAGILTPVECAEVCEYIIARNDATNRRLDMRLLINCFADRLLWKNGIGRRHWQDRIDSRINELIGVAARPSRAEKVEAERQLAKSIKHLNRAERERIWKEKTGKGKTALYDRLREL
jgi:hypothetical protein